jgi:hypothetical protein
MAIKALQLAGWIDGDNELYVSGTDHVAGQPAKLTDNGWELALLPSAVLGVFKNDMADELKNAPQAVDARVDSMVPAAVLMGINKVELSAGKLKDKSVQTPFAFPPTSNGAWGKGDRLYVSATGFWDNHPAAVDDPAFGLVVKPATSATDTLEVVMFSSATALTQSDVAGFLSADAAGRALMASGFFDQPTVADKFAAKSIRKAQVAIFVSTERTATGSAENVAHGLGAVPSFVFVVPTDTSPSTVGVFTVTEGAHDGTNAVVTVTLNKKYKVVAMA